ncbi:hypothetical protein O0L34_g14665 [Tuta absoluta]|nr:hypothetical protein O0L34_g14665 [Tuta absoluta]
MMDAVHNNTSIAACISHHQNPKIQYPISSLANENGIITSPRKKSDTANDAMNQFWMFFNAFSVTIAIITNILPTTTIIIKTVTTTEAIIMWAGEYPLGYEFLSTNRVSFDV